MIETYNDFSYIMYIICEMTASYYSRIKNIVNIPIIICSTGLSILNTTELSDSSFDKIVIIRNCGIAFNLLIALSIAILNAYKITEKEFSFKTQSVNFLKIHNKINVDLAKCKNTMSPVDILDIVKEYNLLCESLCFHIPSHIQRYVKHNYRNYKQPFMLSRPKKERRSSIISYYINKENDNESSVNFTSASETSVTSDASVTSVAIETSEENQFDLEFGYLPNERLSPIPSVPLSHKSEISEPKNKGEEKRDNKIKHKKNDKKRTKRNQRSPINALNSKFRKSFKVKQQNTNDNVANDIV